MEPKIDSYYSFDGPHPVGVEPIGDDSEEEGDERSIESEICDNLPYIKQKIAAIAHGFFGNKHSYQMRLLWDEVSIASDDEAVEIISRSNLIWAMPELLLNSRIGDDLLGVGGQLVSREQSGFCAEDIARAHQEYNTLFRGVNFTVGVGQEGLGAVSLPNVTALIGYSKILDDIEVSIDKSYIKQERFLQIAQLLTAVAYLSSQHNLFTEEDNDEIMNACDFFASALDKKDKDFSDELYIRYEALVNRLSANLYEAQLTDPAEFHDDSEFRFVVHASSLHTLLKDSDAMPVKEFYRKNTISTSLISEKQMGTYGNSMGLIFSPPAAAILTAQPHDVYSYDHGNSAVFGSGMDKTIPPILPPEVVISETLNRTDEEHAELDHRGLYNEIVLNLEFADPTGVFIISNGEGALHSDYKYAAEYAQRAGLPLVEIDMSKYREQAGLSPFSDKTRANIVRVIVNRCVNELLNAGKISMFEQHPVYEDGFEDDVWNLFLEWRKDGGHTRDEMIQLLIKDYM